MRQGFEVVLEGTEVSDRAGHSNIETLRVFATCLLVAYHTIGVPNTGLHLDYPHPLRIFADFFVDLRMPLFAFIAGWVYAIRPIGKTSFRDFATGKLRRLYVPGVAAALIYWVVASSIVKDAIGANTPLIEVITLSYAHYWFLQAILIILFCYALFDMLLGQKALLPFLVLSLTLFLVVQKSPMTYFEIDSAAYLSPYFCIGLLAQRYDARGRTYYLPITAVLLVSILTSLVLCISFFKANGFLPNYKTDLQSILFSFAAVFLLWMYLPSISLLSRFGAVSFTVYLYHVFGSSGGRRLGANLGLENEYLLFLLSFACGLIFPLILHRLVSGWNISRVLMLGLRPIRIEKQ